MILSLVRNKICTALPRTCNQDADAKAEVDIQLVLKPQLIQTSKSFAMKTMKTFKLAKIEDRRGGLHTNQLAC